MSSDKPDAEIDKKDILANLTAGEDREQPQSVPKRRTVLSGIVGSAFGTVGSSVVSASHQSDEQANDSADSGEPISKDEAYSTLAAHEDVLQLLYAADVIDSPTPTAFLSGNIEQILRQTADHAFADEGEIPAIKIVKKLDSGRLLLLLEENGGHIQINAPEGVDDMDILEAAYPDGTGGISVQSSETPDFYVPHVRHKRKSNKPTYGTLSDYEECRNDEFAPDDLKPYDEFDSVPLPDCYLNLREEEFGYSCISEQYVEALQDAGGLTGPCATKKCKCEQSCGSLVPGIPSACNACDSIIATYIPPEDGGSLGYVASCCSIIDRKNCNSLADCPPGLAFGSNCDQY